jgi:hypothetical protein
MRPASSKRSGSILLAERERNVDGTTSSRHQRNRRTPRCQVLKGNPMLVPDALRAVKKWRYSICLLQGQAIEPIAPSDRPA